MLHSAVYHHVWKFGGSTRVALDTAASMCELGSEIVDVVGVTRPSRSIEEEIDGIRCLGKKVYLLPVRFGNLTFAQRMLTPLALRKVLRARSPSCLWVDYNTYRPVLGLAYERGTRILEYIYFPYEIFYKSELREKLPVELLREAVEYYEGATRFRLKKLYMSILFTIEKRIRRENPFESAHSVLTVSQWTAEIVRHVFGGEPIPVPPMVRPGYFDKYANLPWEERVPRIVMLGRISPEKRIETVIRAVAASETKPPVLVVGSTTRAQAGYLGKLRKEAARLGVRLEVRSNVSGDEMARLAGYSRLFVHAARGEHFGIVVVEAMAAGLPIAVHKSGGPYHEITGRGKYGLVYDDEGDLANIIDLILADPKAWKKYHELSLERRLNYLPEKFIEKLGWSLKNAGCL